MNLCSVEGCQRPCLAKNLCALHYERIRPGAKPCCVEGCERPSRKRRMCTLHYQRWQTHGEAGLHVHYTKPSKPAEERFWSKVNKDGPVPQNRPDLGPCWIWLGSCDSGGYGTFNYNDLTVSAHKFIYKATYEEIPPNKQIDHLCRARNCVNPTHLEVVTQQENFERGKGPAVLAAGRQKRIQQAKEQTHCPHGHLFSPENTYINTKRSRVCRECKRLRGR